MSTVVDNRVVQMNFDNKQFENNCKTSMNTLSELKKGLNFTGASKGLENISSAANGLNLNPLTTAVEKARSGFSALEVMAVTALVNITNSALNAGKNLATAFTITPIKQGFQEYETKMNAVQTILANTQGGTKQVAKAVQETGAVVASTASDSSTAIRRANEDAVDDLQKTHEDALEILKDRLEDEEELLKNNYETQQTLIENSLEEQTESVKKAHEKKLNMYNEEFMAKLKLIDEERYNKIKALDDEIDAINAKTDAEEKELELAEQAKKISELEDAMNSAETYEEYAKAEERLAAYKESIARKQLLEERKLKIEELKTQKDTINNEYELAVENLTKEYDLKVEQANTMLELQVEHITKKFEEESKAAKLQHETDLALIDERKKTELETLEEIQEAEMKALRRYHEDAMDKINARNSAVATSAAPIEFETVTTKGSTLEDVNKALDELNTYADKTIYNFAEMTKNVGTFTAAGVDLDTSVSAIKGIANLAAVSGSTSQQASTAMYQLSQAMASGTVKLMDWNSVVNAGMGGQVFQDALTETARVRGINVDEMIAKEGSFRESLSEGWLTSEVLTETLSKFTGDLTAEQLKSLGYNEEQITGILKLGETANDAATKVKTFTQLMDTLKEGAQSGWSKTWEILIGDFEEAKELWTTVADVFGGVLNSSSEARNNMLQGWADSGGREVAIEAMTNTFKGLVSIVKPITEAFREIFPRTTSEQLLDITKNIRDLTEKFILNDTTSANLKRTFAGLFAALDIGKKAFVAVFDAISPLFTTVGDLGGGVLGLTASWGDWVVKLNDTLEKTDLFNNALTTIVDFIKTGVSVASGIVVGIYDGIKNLITIIGDNISMPGFEGFHSFLERFHTRMSDIGTTADTMKGGVSDALTAISTAIDWETVTSGAEGFNKVLTAIWDGIKTIGKTVGKVFGGVGSGISEAVGEADFDKAFDIINGGLFAGLLIAVTKFTKGLTTSFDDVGGVIDNLKDILDTARGSFEAYQKNIQAKTLLTIASAIAVLAAAILVISLIDSAKLTASLGAVTVLFADLIGSMAVFSKIGGGIKGVVKTTSAMIAISTAVLILAAALKVVASIEPDRMFIAIAGIVQLTATIVVAAKALSTGTGKVMKGAANLVLFAAAIKVLASACDDLSELSWVELGKGLLGVGVLMTSVSLFLNNTKFSSKAISTATGMVIMAGAIKILASACSDFGDMSWEEIAKGLTAIGLLLAEVAIFTKATGDAKNVISTGTDMVLLGAAMKILASAMSDFGNMSWEEIIKGLVGMAGALVAITVAVNFMPKNMVGIGLGMIAISTALLILASAIEQMGHMTWDEIAKGLTVLGGSMLILAVGLNIMTGTLSGSAALIVAALALAVLAPTLSLLGAMSWEAIAKGLITIAGAFAIIGVAGLLLGPILPAILGLGAAFALIGVGVTAIGAGLALAGLGITALAAGFASLATIGVLGATAIVASLTIIITGVVALIPAIIAEIGKGIVIFIETIVTAIPTICEAVITIITSIVGVLVECVPLIVDAIFVLLTSVLTTLAENMPTIVQAVFDILLACLKGIADNISMVVQTAIDIVLNFIAGIAEKIPDVIQSGFDLLISFINGITEAIATNTPVLVEALVNLMLTLITSSIEALTGGITLFKEIGSKIMNSGFVQGLKDKFEDIFTAIRDLIKDMIKVVTGKVKDFKSAAGDVMSGFIEGIKGKISSAVKAVKEFASEVVDSVKDFLNINSPSKVFYEIGEYSGEGYINALEDQESAASKAGEGFASQAVNGLRNTLSKVSDALNSDIDMQPTIRPVLDLSNVESGSKRISNLLSTNRAISINSGMNDQYRTTDSGISAPTGTTLQFTQNNYSPKALSRVEIYRQTKNQFSSLERMVTV